MHEIFAVSVLIRGLVCLLKCVDRIPYMLTERLFYTSVSLLLPHIQGYRYHLSKFHIYALVYCIDQPWDLFGRNDAKTETPVLWPPHAKS